MVSGTVQPGAEVSRVLCPGRVCSLFPGFTTIDFLEAGKFASFFFILLKPDIYAIFNNLVMEVLHLEFLRTIRNLVDLVSKPFQLCP